MNLLIALINTLFLCKQLKAIGDGEAGEAMAHHLLAIWLLYHTTVDRKAISVDVKLSTVHAFNKSLCAKFSKFGSNH